MDKLTLSYPFPCPLTLKKADYTCLLFLSALYISSADDSFADQQNNNLTKQNDNLSQHDNNLTQQNNILT
jgi:hypothetical protein